MHITSFPDIWKVKHIQEDVSRAMTFDLDLYPQGHSAVTSPISWIIFICGKNITHGWTTISRSIDQKTMSHGPFDFCGRGEGYPNVSRSRSTISSHDDVIKWKHFPRNWPFVRGIHRGPVNSPHKGQWRVDVKQMFYPHISIKKKSFSNDLKKRGIFSLSNMCLTLACISFIRRVVLILCYFFVWKSVALKDPNKDVESNNTQLLYQQLY